MAKLEEGYDIIRHSGLEAVFPDNAEVLVTKLGVQALVRVAEGDAGCTSEGAALLWALLRGKKPVIVEEGIEWRTFKGAMSPSLAAKYASHERILASYGAVFVGAADAANVLSGKSCPNLPTGNLSVVTSSQAKRKKVINEVELMRLCPASAGPGQNVELGQKDILTPLAEDYIAKMRINVTRVG